jgi:hypothetical protein
MSAIASQIGAVAESHERVIGELTERPMRMQDLAAATGLSAAMLIGTLRVLERGGRVRSTPRGQYELVRVPATMDNTPEPAAAVVSAPVQPNPIPEPIRQPPAIALASTPIVEIELSEPRRNPSVSTKVCSAGADCVDGPNPKPAGAFYGKAARCKRCVLKAQKDRKAGVTKPARKKAKRATAAVPAARNVQGGVAPLLLPASQRIGCALEIIDGSPVIQLGADSDTVIQLTPAQMDRVCNWWEHASEKIG